MVDLTVPTPSPSVTTEQPRSAVTGAVFNRPLPSDALAHGMEQLGAGAEDLATNLARAKAQQDAQNMVVTTAPDGSVQAATPENSIILGRAGAEYQSVLADQTKLMLGNQATQALTNIQLQHRDNPAEAKAAFDQFLTNFRQSTTDAFGPEVGNQAGALASADATRRWANIAETDAERQTRLTLSGLETNIADTQNRMRTLARSGGIGTPDYDRMQDQLQDYYNTLKGNKLYGYAPERADSEYQTSLSMDRGEAIVGNVDAIFKRTSGDGGRAGAQKMLEDKVLNNTDLNLSDQERKQLYAQGMAHLQYLTSDQKAAIDANRQNVVKLTDALSTGKTVDPAVVNQAIEQAKSLGDAESVMKIQAYAAQAAAAKPYAGMNDEQRLRAMATPGDYISRLRSQENASGSNTASPGTSSALGRYQFTDGTWAAVARQHPELGLTPDGRTDPNQQDRAIVAFTNDNKAALRNAGIPDTDANTYMAHFLGAGGATSFLKAMQADPSQPAAAINLAAATANPTIFYKPGADGKPDPSQPRSLSEVYALQTRKFGGGTTPVVAAGIGGAPSRAAMASNPFALTAYLDSLTRGGANEVSTAKNVGSALVTQFSQGNVPNPETVAAFNQMVTRHPEELGEIGQKVQKEMSGAVVAQQAQGMPPAAGQAYIDNVGRLSQGQDLNTMATAEAAKTIYDRGVQALKNDPWGEAARRGWIARPPMPPDFTKPETLAPAIAEHGQAATVMGSFTQNAAQPAFSPTELPAIKSVMTTGTIDQRMALAQSIVGANMPEPVFRATLEQLGKDSATRPLAIAGDVAKFNPQVAHDIIAGHALMQADPKLAPNKEDYPSEFAKILPFNDLPDSAARQNYDAAIQALYAKRSAEKGDTTGVLDQARLEQVVKDVTGGVVSWRGGKAIAPWYGATDGDYDAAIRLLKDSDLANSRGSDGVALPAAALKPSVSALFGFGGQWSLQSVDGGKYMIYPNNGTMPRQYLKDVRGGNFVLDLGAQRQAVEAQRLHLAAPFSPTEQAFESMAAGL